MPLLVRRQCRRLRVALGLCLLAAVPACAPRRQPVYPARGEVLVDGKPAAGAVVLFHPAGPPSNGQAMRPYGTVAEDGTFVVSTYESGDGAPAGDYVVTVLPDPAAPDPLPVAPAYTDPATSPLRAHIEQSQTNRLPPFALPAPPPEAAFGPPDQEKAGP